MEALEKKLGISQDGAGPSSEPLAGKKHRLEDTEYIEQSKDLVDNVKSAVSAGTHFLTPLIVSYIDDFGSTAMLKKKKAKTGHSSAATSSASTGEKVAEAVNAVTTASSAVAEPILESSATVPVVAVAAVAAGVASA